jgi:hypothetical protein
MFARVVSIESDAELTQRSQSPRNFIKHRRDTLAKPLRRSPCLPFVNPYDEEDRERSDSSARLELTTHLVEVKHRQDIPNHQDIELRSPDHD